jgi:heavy metal translocating P-type ATPase
MNVRVNFPQAGVIDIDHPMFRRDDETCRRFVLAIFAVDAVSRVRLCGHAGGRATLWYDSGRVTSADVLTRLSRSLQGSHPNVDHSPLRVSAPQRFARDRRGVANLQRHGNLISGWRLIHARVGRATFRHATIFRRKDLAREIERELLTVLGINRCTSNTLLGTVTIDHDPRELSRTRLVGLLDQTLVAASIPVALDRVDLSLAACTASVPLAIAASTAAPALLPVSAVLLVATSVPFLKGSFHTLIRQKRVGCEALDTLVVAGCIATLQLVPGAVLCWCLAVGRALVKRTEDRSKAMLRSVAGKLPQSVWLVKKGVEIRVPLEQLEQGDVIVVHTGESIPVDGVVAEGLATVDQQALTGESMPVERGAGDRVFASTTIVGGKLFVAVESRGAETASARIARILQATAGHRLSRQATGERLADKAAAPMIALGGVGYATLGPAAAVAIVNADLGTGIRLAAPAALLSSIALAASKGILVKEGQALERFRHIDTVVFDKTGTLTRERPEVGKIFACCKWQPDEVLQFAAAAEAKFHHPIALAIRHAAAERGLPRKTPTRTEFRVGLGVTVEIEGSLVHVGSRRFLESEGIGIDGHIRSQLEQIHTVGNTAVIVAIDRSLAGLIELEASVRPEVEVVVAGLRARGITSLAILSGDHDAPTRRLAEQFGMDMHLAEVLPDQKAATIERLQREGRKVCFIGDGVNDAMALKQADVSISLRGATSLATDTADILFLDGGLGRLCDLHDIATDLDRNVRRSWQMLVVPNAICVAGVFTLGWGVMASVVLNNVSALAALANGLIPMRKAMAAERGRTALGKTADNTGRSAFTRERPRLRVIDSSAADMPQTRQPADCPLPRRQGGMIPLITQHSPPHD